MSLELIATLIAGIGGAGVVLLLRRLLGGRLPRWWVPAAAGLSMLIASVAMEYSWFPGTRDAMPEQLTITETVQSRAIYRPWTYVVPLTDRFVAVDRGSILAAPDRPQLRLANSWLFMRWRAPQSMAVLVDCAGGRRIALGTTVSERLESGGDLDDLNWLRLEAEDRMQEVICNGG